MVELVEEFCGLVEFVDVAGRVELVQVALLGVLCELVLQAGFEGVVHVRRGGFGGASQSRGRR